MRISWAISGFNLLLSSTTCSSRIYASGHLRSTISQGSETTHYTVLFSGAVSSLESTEIKILFTSVLIFLSILIKDALILVNFLKNGTRIGYLNFDGKWLLSWHRMCWRRNLIWHRAQLVSVFGACLLASKIHNLLNLGLFLTFLVLLFLILFRWTILLILLFY